MHVLAVIINRKDVDTRVQACVPFYGVYDFTDRNRHFQGSLLLPMLERSIMKRTGSFCSATSCTI